MDHQGYKQFIESQVLQLSIGEPIYTQMVIEALCQRYNFSVQKARTLVNVNLKRMADQGRLERYRKGVYYLAQDTPFGKTKLNPAKVVADRYLRDQQGIIGYETGISFLNKLGVTTQVPQYRSLATNAYRQYGNRVNSKLNVILRKPKTMVNQENYRYLQFLDALAELDQVKIDTPFPEKLFLSYLNEQNLDFIKIVAYGNQYYPKKVQRRIVEIAKTTLT